MSDVLTEVGVFAPRISGGWPLNATAWEDKGQFVKGWTILPENFQPSPGDVGSFEGHVGIVVEKGKSASANYDQVTVNDWGFRSFQKPTFRRYIGN